MKVGGKKIKKEEETLFSKVDGIYIDGKKDATLVMVKGQNGKYYSTVQIEEHYAVVGEPGKIILKCNFTITSIFNTVEPGICFEEQIV